MSYRVYFILDPAHLQLVVCGSTSCHQKGCSALRTFEVVLYTNRQLDRLHGQTLTWRLERHPVSTRHGKWCIIRNLPDIWAAHPRMNTNKCTQELVGRFLNLGSGKVWEIHRNAARSLLHPTTSTAAFFPRLRAQFLSNLAEDLRAMSGVWKQILFGTSFQSEPVAICGT